MHHSTRGPPSTPTPPQLHLEEELEAMELDESPVDYEANIIPPLPAYHRDVIEPNVRPCSPQEFSKLFPRSTASRSDTMNSPRTGT